MDAGPATCILIIVQSLRPLLGRTLVLVAHPDDEAVGCGALLQTMEEPLVIFATDGAPRSECFWKNFNSREEYAQARAMEAKHALAAAGVQHWHWLCANDCIVDQELYQNLDRAYDDLLVMIDAEMPTAILSMAYEGGHPDHDACSFLASQAANELGIEIWEMPLYHRQEPKLMRQRFLDAESAEELDIDREELVCKMNMFAAYDSQAEVLREFLPYVERFRPMKAYDFNQPPHSGQLNYEAWQWPMKGADLCRAFNEFVRKAPARKHKWGTAA
ncbi:MAG TPA: PIG-L family deacetylase [Terriglobales bacterium]|nr:PIG-L family deacetylase [Terriglobales bacterium]